MFSINLAWNSEYPACSWLRFCKIHQHSSAPAPMPSESSPLGNIFIPPGSCPVNNRGTWQKWLWNVCLLHCHDARTSSLSGICKTAPRTRVWDSAEWSVLAESWMLCWAAWGWQLTPDRVRCVLLLLHCQCQLRGTWILEDLFASVSVISEVVDVGYKFFDVKLVMWE